MSINIDEAFQRKKQRTSATVVSDEQNKMDNWFYSSNLLKAQRHGTNSGKFNSEADEELAKRLEAVRGKWNALSNGGNFATREMHLHSKDWTGSSFNTTNAIRQAKDLTFHRPVPPVHNRRKVLRALINSKEHIVCPDSGSQKNIMSESLVCQRHFEIHRGPEGLKDFELGSGKSVRSIGRVRVSVQLPGITLQKAKRWFYVFKDCPVDIVLGMEFLEEAEVLTKHRHLLENCPADLHNLSSLLWIGSPKDDNSARSIKNRLRCSLDGRDLVAVADTGSDLNIMSLPCAKREGFRIDTREEARTWVQFGDGSKSKTTGQVYVYNLSLDWRTTETPISTQMLPNLGNEWGGIGNGNSHVEHHDGPFCTVFHVLPGLPCDVIFGRDLLDQTDAFNRCPELSSPLSAGKDDHFEFKVLISLGRLTSKLRSSKHKQTSNIPLPNTKEAHDEERHSEIFRRSQKKEEIALMPERELDQAKAKEKRRVRAWDAAHATCIHCLPV
jgi:hypothetical protein